MSLINDALRKRREAEGLQPLPTHDLGLQPLDLHPPSDGGADEVVSRAKWFWLIAVVVVVIVNGGLFLWFAQKKAVEARARAAEMAETQRQAAAEAEAERLRLAAEAAAAQAAASNAALAEAELERKQIERPDFRLQSVVFHPTRPSAMVNNRVVFVGDRVEGYGVKRINETEVVLAVEGDEVTLSLP